MDDPTIGNATAILLSCMDFRYPQAIINHMRGQGLEGQYYHVILAGASLGANLDTQPHLKPNWRNTFFDHLQMVLTPPGPITKVHILDHRDCKAYRLFRGLPENVDRDRETAAHNLELHKLKAALQQRYGGLPVFTGLLERLKEEEEFKVLEIE